MARNPSTVESAIERFCKTIESDPNYAPRTARFYREQCTGAFHYLRQIREDAMPQDVTADDLRRLIELMRENKLAVATQRGYVHALRRICFHYRNHALIDVTIVWPDDIRPHVDWLTNEQATQLIHIDKTPMQDVLITLELCMGLRRCEVLRLCVDDVHDGWIDVTGKGRGGGKMRSVPFHPRFQAVLNRWMAERNYLIETARSHRSAAVVPDELLIYRRGYTLKAYSEVRGTGIDSQLKQLSDRLGFSFSNHTLRRTFGREMWRSGAPIVTIATLLGHKSTEQTMRYIGANLDDMSSAMRIFNLR